MIEWESDLNYIALENCQQVGERLEKELKNISLYVSNSIRQAFILTHKGRLPQIKELRQPKSYKQVFSKLKKKIGKGK
jgi:hypothetical protein